MIIDNLTFSILILAMGASHVFLLGLPFSISLFYERIFNKRIYPFLFIISGVFFVISFFVFSQDFFSAKGSAFFAAGGILLSIASIRLYLVMTGGK